MQRSSHERWLVLIGIFKLAKAALLLVAGIGLLRLVHKDTAAVVNHWINLLRIDPDNRYLHRFIARALSVDSRKLKELSAGTFCYAGLFLTEGTGLLLRKRWGEYFTTITTASLLPLEFYELARHITPAKCVVAAINIAIVIYLASNLRRSGNKR